MRLSISVTHNPRLLDDDKETMADSAKNYEVLVREQIESQYPGALIDIQRGLNCVYVYDYDLEDPHTRRDPQLREIESIITTIVRIIREKDQVKWLAAREPKKSEREKKILAAADAFRSALDHNDKISKALKDLLDTIDSDD